MLIESGNVNRESREIEVYLLHAERTWFRVWGVSQVGHLSSSLMLKRFWYVPIGACPVSAYVSCAARLGVGLYLVVKTPESEYVVFTYAGLRQECQVRVI
jgi:hypothetical protein